MVAPDEPAAATEAIRLALTGIERGPALQCLALAARAGELVGLCSEDAAGRTAVIELLAGESGRGGYRGEVHIDGVARRLGSPREARRAGVEVVRQGSALVPQLSVAHNLMLGREPRRFGLVDEARLEAQARTELDACGLTGQVATGITVGTLATGLQRIIEIARAAARGARVLVLDDPAAGLSPGERERLFAWLRTRRPADVACLYVGHRLDELLAVCDPIVVVRGGASAQSLPGATRSRPCAAGRYRIHDEIAAGGMATVHLGKIQGPFGFTSTVAIKRLHPQLARDPEFVAMFLDEARLASRVRHPNVVPVLDIFAEDGELSLVMEYVEGESLGQLTALTAAGGAPVPVAIATTLVASILHGLHAAHEARDERGALLGLVHRDVSPQNVIVGTDGVVRLIDFGIAKAAGRHGASRSRQLKGKIAYMAPEQLRGGAVSARTDVYGASVLLWELLTGERLFDGETEGLILGRVLDDEVPPPRSLSPELPAALDAITLRGLDRDPARRFESARAMARALEAAVPPAPAAAIGDWVHGLAAPRLAARRDQLARLEREVVTAAPG